MKRTFTTFFITVSLVLSLTSWRAFTSRADSSRTGQGQQVGEPFRIPAIAAGIFHSLALKSDGSVVAWGANNYGQTTVPSAAQSGVVAIAAGGSHNLALKSDGSVVAWGRNDEGQTTVPGAAQSGITAIAAGAYHSLALKSDGSVVAWGLNGSGQTTVPGAAQSGVIAIAAGVSHSLALKSDGSVIAWGNNNYGQASVPSAAQSNVTAIAAGILVNETGGEIGLGLNQGTPQQRAEIFLQQIEPVMPGLARHYNGKVRLDYWPGEQWARGSYSYWAVGQYTRFAGVEGQREGRCHFAGEHTSIDSQGYLNGAVETGQRAAQEILAALRTRNRV